MLKIIQQLGGLKAGFNNPLNAISHRVRRPKKGMSSFCGFHRRLEVFSLPAFRLCSWTVEPHRQLRRPVISWFSTARFSNCRTG